MNIEIDTPYVTVAEYARRTGLAESTVRAFIRQGRILILEKAGKEAVLVNMVAMTKFSAEQASRVEAPLSKESGAR
jgi:hypothetical protein